MCDDERRDASVFFLSHVHHVHLLAKKEKKRSRFCSIWWCIKSKPSINSIFTMMKERRNARRMTWREENTARKRERKKMVNGQTNEVERFSSTHKEYKIVSHRVPKCLHRMKNSVKKTRSMTMIIKRRREKKNASRILLLRNKNFFLNSRRFSVMKLLKKSLLLSNANVQLSTHCLFCFHHSHGFFLFFYISS